MEWKSIYEHAFLEYRAHRACDLCASLTIMRMTCLWSGVMRVTFI